MLMRKSYLLMASYLCVSIFLLSGCKVKTAKDYENPKDLYARAQKLLEKKNYTDAAEHFENLQNRFPESPLAIEAEFQKCEAYFKQGEFIEAEYAYAQFRKLHPTHPKIAHVTLQIGKAQLKQARKAPERDQTYTKSSLGFFSEVVRKYPGTEASQEALKLQQQAQMRLLQRELYIGSFYIKLKKYPSALNRLLPLLENHTFTKLHQEARYKAALAHYKLKQPEEAKALLEQKMETGLAQSKYAKKIAQLLKKIS